MNGLDNGHQTRILSQKSEAKSPIQSQNISDIKESQDWRIWYSSLAQRIQGLEDALKDGETSEDEEIGEQQMEKQIQQKGKELCPIQHVPSVNIRDQISRAPCRFSKCSNTGTAQRYVQLHGHSGSNSWNGSSFPIGDRIQQSSNLANQPLVPIVPLPQSMQHACKTDSVRSSSSV